MTDCKDLISKTVQDKMIELFGEKDYAEYLEWKKFQQMQEMERYLKTFTHLSITATAMGEIKE